MYPAFDGELGATSVAWSPNDQYVAATNFYGMAIWSADDGTLVSKMRDGLQDGSSNVSWSPDGKRVARASSDWYGRGGYQVSIWDIVNWASIANLAGGIRSHYVTWHPDSRAVALVGNDDIRVVAGDSWHTDVTAELAGDVTCMALAPDATLIAVGTKVGIIVLLDPVTGATMSPWYGPAEQPRLLAWSPDSSLLAVATDGRAIHIWSVREAVLLAAIDSLDGSPVRWQHGPIPPGYSRSGTSQLRWTAPNQMQCITDSGRLLTWTLRQSIDDVLVHISEPAAIPDAVKQRFGLA